MSELLRQTPAKVHGGAGLAAAGAVTKASRQRGRAGGLKIPGLM